MTYIIESIVFILFFFLIVTISDFIFVNNNHKKSDLVYKNSKTILTFNIILLLFSLSFLFLELF